MSSTINNLSIYLINLDNSHERLAQAEKEFNSKQLSFERFSAVNGKKLSEEYITHIHKNQKWLIPLIANEIACYKSHIDVLKYFLAHSDNEYACICEDDIALDDYMREGLEAIIADWPEECDMIKCFGGVVMAGKTVRNFKTAHTDIEIINPVKINAGGLCYIVSRSGAQKFIENMPFKRPFDIDHQLIWEHGCRIFQTNSLKNMINDYGNQSNIGIRKRKPFLPHTLYKISFFMHNLFYNTKRWGWIETIKQLSAYRKERLKRKKA